jgi:hypothetical protein
LQRRPRNPRNRNDDDGKLEDWEIEMNKNMPDLWGDPKIYTPTKFTPSDLVTNRIATASSTPVGNQASVQAAFARLSKRDDTYWTVDREMARKLNRGEAMRFANEEERVRIVALANEMTFETSIKKSRQKKSYVAPIKSEYASIDKKSREELVDRVLKGDYREMAPKETTKGKKKQEDTSDAASVAKAIWLNGTYTPTQGKGFMGMLNRFITPPAKGKA